MLCNTYWSGFLSRNQISDLKYNPYFFFNEDYGSEKSYLVDEIDNFKFLALAQNFWAKKYHQCDEIISIFYDFIIFIYWSYGIYKKNNLSEVPERKK